MVELMSRIARQFSLQGSERQISLAGDHKEAAVLADRDLLHLALTQLIDNALKYSPPDSVVSVSVSVENGYVITRVQNESSSIGASERDRIFERFYRGTATRDNVSGAGLGLYVARKIAMAHGGNVGLDESSPDNSVVFYLRLPISGDDSHHVRCDS